jgi:hypothetical protein
MSQGPSFLHFGHLASTDAVFFPGDPRLRARRRRRARRPELTPECPIGLVASGRIL